MSLITCPNPMCRRGVWTEDSYCLHCEQDIRDSIQVTRKSTPDVTNNQKPAKPLERTV